MQKMLNLTYSLTRKILLIIVVFAGAIFIASVVANIVDLKKVGIADKDICSSKINEIYDALEAVELGDEYFYDGEKRNLPCARRAYKKALEVDDLADTNIWYKAGMVDLLDGRMSSAIYKFRKHLEVSDDTGTDVNYEFALAYSSRASKDDSIHSWNKAEKIFESYLETAPEDSWARIDMAWMLFVERKYEEMKLVLEAGFKYDSDNIVLSNMYGLALLHSSESIKAEEYFINNDAGTSWIAKDLNRTYPGYELRDSDQRQRELRTRCEDEIRNTISPSKLFEAGQWYFEGGEYDLWCATHAYKKAVMLNPQVSEIAWHQLGRVYFLEGRFASALQSLSTQNELYGETYPPVYYMLGLTNSFKALDHETPELWPVAEEYFRQYLTLMPNSPWAYNDLAWTLFSQERYADMLEATEDGLESHPYHAWLLNMNGLALMNLERFEEAQTSFQKAKKQASYLTPEEWGGAYPGNDNRLYTAGLNEFKTAIETNISLVEERIINSVE